MLNEHGAKVVIAGRREARLQEISKEVKFPENIAYSVADVTVPEQVQATIDLAIEKWGRLDVTFNNSGIMPLGMLADPSYNIDVWKKTFDTNVIGVLNGIKASLPQMHKQKSGLIISTSSVVGHVVMPAGAAYSGSKFAVRAIMEVLRQEERENGIRSSIITPGATRTELTNSIGNEAIQKAITESSNDDLDYAVRPEDLANAVLYMVDQPDHVSVSELIVRPRKQEI
ncbi:SDR family oxidoreductase [Oenococcus alcoholitolerans]|uniref:Oxidoreductase n=1 Tax=Oenococcus alcoholitolerans TaxID=931074 RepID=A0ABR4XSM2_9LACO|nr:oxidoreductase [Oenococcus alcoholitolerans]